MNPEILNVAYHCTDNYIDITATSILSLFEHNKLFREVNVYIIENGFTNATRNKCTALADRYGRHIYFVPVGDISKLVGFELVQIKKKWLLDSYSRLFLDKYLPESVDRVLYLDGDTLITDDLYELWRTDLKDNYCAAVRDCLSREYNRLFGLKDDTAYCNSGVILIDLKRWREHNIGLHIKEYVSMNNGYIFFMEQTAFNYVLQDKIAYLDAKYNVTTTMQALTYDDILTIRRPVNFYSREKVMQALEHPVIIHMTSLFFVINRAWNEYTDHPARLKFAMYHEKLGWGNFDMQKDKRTLKSKLVDAVVHVIPRKILAFIVSILYNYVRIIYIRLNSKE